MGQKSNCLRIRNDIRCFFFFRKFLRPTLNPQKDTQRYTVYKIPIYGCREHTNITRRQTMAKIYLEQFQLCLSAHIRCWHSFLYLPYPAKTDCPKMLWRLSEFVRMRNRFGILVVFMALVKLRNQTYTERWFNYIIGLCMENWVKLQNFSTKRHAYYTNNFICNSTAMERDHRIYQEYFNNIIE